MAIHTSALRIVAGWFAPQPRSESSTVQMPAQTKTQSPHPKITWPEDDAEAGRVRKAQVDLMKYQTINRGF
jgi:hypothetical protein